MTRFPVGTFRTSCNIDLTDYPYDSQECNVYFGSWSHNQDQINITTLGNSINNRKVICMKECFLLRT